MKKKIVSFGMILCLLVLAACGGGKSTPEAGTSASPASSGPSDNQNKEKVKIVFWDSMFTQRDGTPKDTWFIFKAIKKFEDENPNIKVERVESPADIQQYDSMFRAAGMAENGPDLANVPAGGAISSFAAFLEPLDEYLKEEQGLLNGWDVVKEGLSNDGKILALPVGAGSYFEIFYNKELFKTAGLESFTPPANWDELIALAQKLKAAGVNPFQMGELEGYNGAWVMGTLVGGQIGTNGYFDMKAGKLPLNDGSMVTAYENYKKLYELGLTNKDAGSTKNQESNQLFIQGKGAMTFGGSWSNGDMYTGMKDNVGNFPIPTLAGAPHAGAIAGGPQGAIVMTKYSKHKEEALKFLKFMGRADTLDSYVEIQQVEPSNHKDAHPDLIKNPLLKSQAEWLKSGNTVYPFDNIMPQEINDMFYRENAQVFAGKANPKDAADKLQKEFEKLQKLKK